MPLDKSIKDQIVLAALSAAGPAGDNAEEHEAAVLANVRQITATLLDDTSKFHKAADEIETASKFVGIIYLVKKEESSKRGLVYFEEAKGPVAEFRPRYTFEQVVAAHQAQVEAKAKGQKTPDLPEGIELIRTERTDILDGLNLARQATGLQGHRALIFKVMEPTRDPQKKVRVLRHLKDLGVVDSYKVPRAA
ncbi:hypothetical protein [Agromyces humi]|uniref:hypothetical protein n=1 Tax=Agromyces humi TaxID=1766800 RepID=UPI00135AFF97|nr:hypothetical protein [Agromyces humi]